MIVAPLILILALALIIYVYGGWFRTGIAQLTGHTPNWNRAAMWAIGRIFCDFLAVIAFYAKDLIIPAWSQTPQHIFHHSIAYYASGFAIAFGAPWLISLLFARLLRWRFAKESTHLPDRKWLKNGTFRSYGIWLLLIIIGLLGLMLSGICP